MFLVTNRSLLQALQFIHRSKLFINRFKLCVNVSVLYKLISWRPAEAATRGVLCKKVFLEIFRTSKISLRPATLLKKRLRHRCFPVKFLKFLRTAFPTEHLWWLHLVLKRNNIEKCLGILVIATFIIVPVRSK